MERPWDFSSSETEKRAHPDPAASGCHGELPTECLAPGLLVAVAEAGCLPGVLSAYGWARSVASVPCPGCPDSLAGDLVPSTSPPESVDSRPTSKGRVSQGSGAPSWVWPVMEASCGTSRPLSAQPGAAVTAGETDVLLALFVLLTSPAISTLSPL